MKSSKQTLPCIITSNNSKRMYSNGVHTFPNVICKYSFLCNYDLHLLQIQIHFVLDPCCRNHRQISCCRATCKCTLNSLIRYRQTQYLALVFHKTPGTVVSNLHKNYLRHTCSHLLLHSGDKKLHYNFQAEECVKCFLEFH